MKDANALRDAIELDLVRVDRKSMLRHAAALRALRNTPADERLIAFAYAELGGEEEDAASALRNVKI